MLNNLDTENPLNNDAIIGKQIRDGIGLGMSENKMLKFKFGD
jgi:hypothetical protein